VQADPRHRAESLAGQFPELTIRVEPAHREAYADHRPYGQGSPLEWQLAEEALWSWAEEQGIDPKQLSLGPEDLGVRITYLASGPPSETTAPECDFARPFAGPARLWRPGSSWTLADRSRREGGIGGGL
jgi:hypothetical protein